MAANVSDFLVSLGKALEGICAINKIWIHQAAEGKSTDTAAYVVLRVYGGPSPEDRQQAGGVQQISIQAMATGQVPSETLSLAAAVYDGLFFDDDDNGGERMLRYDWDIEGYKLVNGAAVASGDTWRIVLIDIAQPAGLLGRDEQTGKNSASFNFDVRFYLNA